MKCTSAEANKLLRKLNEEAEAILMRESLTKEFVAATIEKLEDARPAYDFAQVQGELRELERKIRVLKHAINVFNVSQVLPGFDMTIDQALICIPQLSQRKRKLAEMRSAPEKRRNELRTGSSIIEYTYPNYELSAAEEEYNRAADELARLQNALDLVNSTVSFEVDL